MAMAEFRNEDNELKHQRMRANPETLFEDKNRKGRITNLLFYTEQITFWERKFCEKYPHVDKQKIDKGEQLRIYNNQNKERKNRYLTVNFYQNGIVMVQGKQDDLMKFKETFNIMRT